MRLKKVTEFSIFSEEKKVRVYWDSIFSDPARYGGVSSPEQFYFHVNRLSIRIDDGKDLLYNDGS